MFNRKFSNTIRLKKRAIITFFFALVVTLGLGYSAFYSDFNISGLKEIYYHRVHF